MMDRPLQIYSVGDGAREVYYTRLTEHIVMKIAWNGEQDFVDHLPTDRLAVNIPRPVAEKMNVASLVVAQLSPEIQHLKAELGMARERESAMRQAMEDAASKTWFGSALFRKLKGA
jgi:hypothetical protein